MNQTTSVRLSMSESEICASYRAARSKKAQIRILAELNACKPEQILQVLTSSGYVNPALPDTNLPPVEDAGKKKSARVSAADREPELRRLLDEGHSAIEIARYWNVSANRVHVLMRKFGLSVIPQAQPVPERPPQALFLVNVVKDRLNDALNAFSNGSDSLGLVRIGEMRQALHDLYNEIYRLYGDANNPEA